MTVTRYADTGGLVETSADPTSADDRTAGYFKNTLWRNTGTGRLWISSDDAIGAAVWDQVAVVPRDAEAGSILYLDASGKIAALAPGEDGEIIKIASGVPTYAADATT